MSSVRLLNPDYEYLFFDDGRVEEFIAQEFPQYRAVFESFEVPIQRYDFFRYLAVYHYGGFYLDLDVLLGSGLGLGLVSAFLTAVGVKSAGACRFRRRRNPDAPSAPE